MSGERKSERAEALYYTENRRLLHTHAEVTGRVKFAEIECQPESGSPCVAARNSVPWSVRMRRAVNRCIRKKRKKTGKKNRARGVYFRLRERGARGGSFAIVSRIERNGRKGLRLRRMRGAPRGSSIFLPFFLLRCALLEREGSVNLFRALSARAFCGRIRGTRGQWFFGWRLRMYFERASFWERGFRGVEL